ncbi:REP element-mobilizing transposase RayT [Salinibacillus kushneri]|uniref:REP element-mobilizing transposase RayT n=1 Tax=Salinibacillus kushneri TaxID=237682 RepID=A0A1H9YT25_9BACI|nr:transposase [Salinibacillus kushneri]SES72306.1 REP element-mobilizing transposase RayT [Salinibacillus kushneri]
MPRKLRVWHTGEIYHITARGNRKEKIFIETRDYLKYLHYLSDAQENLDYNLHAYCLMPNHVHLLIEMKQIPISQVIKNVHTRYAMYFNFKYEKVGHLFQDRFKSKIVHSSEYLLKVSSYIHLNPIKAGILNKAEKYPWSSYYYYLHKQPPLQSTASNLPLVTTEKVLSYFPDSSPFDYQTFVNSNKEKDEGELLEVEK